LRKTDLGDQTKKNERVWGMWHVWREMRGAYRVSVGNSEEKRPFGISRRR